MDKRLKVKKLYSRLSDAEIASGNKKNLIAAIVSVCAVIALLFIQQRGIRILSKNYYWTNSIIVLSRSFLMIISVFCLVRHFTAYALRREIYENQLPALMGNWHTFAAIEIQLIFFALFFVGEAVMAFVWADLGTIFAALAAALGLYASWSVRSITYECFHNLSEVPPETVKNDKTTAPEQVEEFYEDK